ncbi:Rha family transcriptional regulator [Hydrogenimonas thermophila]|uniref:Rha family transcriptional regulator n=1 Tax=Hydrogenimonas thermophila TaxID=223786 RepID=UPI0029372D9E|nr:Rha family transcriptional regulator [Hydrogenimonas thermophila]WOE69109.1 Rha family transcriptional regulator [Hydrogenimonas thermophila]WOE71619.1 Rha family transcriptional regulator [Hydrogenimonas thermophila]
MELHIIEATVVEEERLPAYEVVVVDDKEIRFELIDGVPMTSSLEVANHFDKLHKIVIRAIEDDPVYDEFIREHKIVLSEYKVPNNNKTYKAYLLDRDAFAYFVMGFTGEKAKRWKLNYIKAFNEMERRLRELTNRPATDTAMLERIDGALQSIRQELEEIKELFTHKKQKAFSQKVLHYLKKGEKYRIEAVKMVLKANPEGINQTNLLKALGKRRDDRAGRYFLHENIGKHWVIKQRGRQIVYFLKETAYLF